MRHWRGRVAGFLAGLLLGGWLMATPAYAQSYAWGAVNGIPFGPGLVLSGTITQTAGNINGVTLAKISQVCQLGDSISNGTWDAYLTTALGASRWLAVEQGVSGNTTTQMAARVVADCITGKRTEYLVVLGGVNDAAAGVSAVDIETQLAAIYAAGKAGGARVVAVTITPWKNSAGYDAAKQTVTDAVNAWILARPTNVDYVVDAYTALEDPGAPDALLAAYNSGDSIHPSAAGYSLLATTVAAAVTWTQDTTTAVALSVDGTSAINQDLKTSATPTFAGAKTTGALWVNSVTNANGFMVGIRATAGNGIMMGAAADLSNATYRSLFLGTNATQDGGRVLVYDATQASISLEGKTGMITGTAYTVGTTAGADCTSAAAVTVAKGIVTGCSQPAATPEQLLALIASLQQRIVALEAMAGAKPPQ